MDALWYNFDMTNQRDFTKCIKKLEKVCRESFEYDEWQRRCKYTDNQDCPVCGDNYYENNSKCESHHHPKTLYTIVEEILDKHLELNDLDNLTGITIMQEIMDLHLLKKVQYINLCQHCHKKFHAGHPEVISKIDEIFTKRINIEKEKDIKETKTKIETQQEFKVVTKEEENLKIEASQELLPDQKKDSSFINIDINI